MKILKSEASTFPSPFKSSSNLTDGSVDSHRARKILQSLMSILPSLLKSVLGTSKFVVKKTFCGEGSLCVPLAEI